jgi:serine/threonine protein kinase
MKVCANCRAVNRPNANFCSNCGEPLKVSPRPSQYVQLQPGALLHGRYRVIEQIGEGGMGRIYLAEDGSGRRYALKQMREPYGAIDTQVYDMYIRSFQREASILSSLPHPFLPIARDFIVSPEQLVIVMDFIEGRTLAEVLEDAPGPLPEKRVMRWAIQVCDALAYLHQKQPPIIHRNIKPKNIMLEKTQDEHIRLIGFGLARHYVEGLPRDEDNLGSAGYSPPEQYGLAQTDARSDIYGLGATLYSLLTKRDPAEFVHAADSDIPRIEFPELRAINPHVSSRANEIIMRALKLEPAMRFQSAVEMKTALLALLEPEPLEPLKQQFQLDQPVCLEETRHVEFKEIRSDDPLSPIKRNVEIYAVAYLNSEGGRILWGIRDSDRTVAGVSLNYGQRDALRRAVTDTLTKIYPPISANAYRINFHEVYQDELAIENMYVVEVIIQPPQTNLLYFTSTGEVYVKTEAGKKKLTGVEIHNELIQRLQHGYGQFPMPDQNSL